MLTYIIRFSIQQRWLVLLLTLFTAGLGFFAMSKLPIDAVPDITNNQVQINVTAPSLSPFDIEKQVTFPIETALAGINGLDHTRSLSRNGFAQITAIFADKVDVYFARQQVSERLNDISKNLPAGAEPHLGPISTGLGEIYMWTVAFSEKDKRHLSADGQPGFQSDGRYLTPEGQYLKPGLEQTTYLRSVQDWVIRPQIRTVPGIASVDSIGGYEKQYHIQPDPSRLQALGLSFSDLAKAIAANNVNLGARYFEENGEGLTVRVSGRLETKEDIGNTVVTTRSGIPVRIKDVASVEIGRDLRTGAGSSGGQEAVIGTALMLIGANSRTVANAVDERMKQISQSLPPDIVVATVLDRTLLVDATIHTVAKNLIEGAALVVVILFLLLGNIKGAVLTALVIPLAMLMTMSGMAATRISANLMSLGALDFGLIVDGAVIITENALRHIVKQKRTLGRTLLLEERLATIQDSTEEMIKPSLYGQAIIILVYVPLLTFTGVESKMFEPMAMTVIIALASAFILSLTFTPALLAIVIRGHVDEKENRILKSLKSLYKPVLLNAIGRPYLYAGGALVLVIVSGILFIRLGQEFIPTLDEKNFAMNATRIPSTSLTQSVSMQLKVEDVIRGFPQVANVFSKTGTAEVASDPMPPNSSDTFIMLKPQADWPDPHLSKNDLHAEIETAVGKLAGNMLEFSQPIQLRFNELLAGTRGDLAIKIYGDDLTVLRAAANQIAEILRSTPGAEDVKVEQTIGLPVFDIIIKKQEASRLGLNVSTIQDVVGMAIGGLQAGVIFEGDRQFPILIRLNDTIREDREALENLPVPLPMEQGMRPSFVPLKQVASFSRIEGPNQISRENGKRRIVVTTNVRDRDISSLVDEARGRVAADVKLHPGYYLSWGGQFENLASARQRLMIVVPGCFFLILVLLYSALGSVRDAIIVFSAVPLALTGGVIALWLRGMLFSVPAAVGFIALSGVAVLNGLVMLTFIRQLIADGKPPRAAITEGALTRLRPVVMTALVASLGFVPMALATGTGAEVQKPLATVVIGGLVSATLLTLVVLPALYAKFGLATRKR